MKTVLSVTVLMCLLLPIQAYATYYQYKGPDGALYYTDNLANVPPNQRADVKQFKGVKSPNPPAVKTQSSQPSPASPSATTENRKNLKTQAMKLEQERVDLDNTYKKLKTERKNLGPRPGPGSSLKEIDAFNQKVSELKAKVAKYKKRRAAFQKKVAAFNAEVKTTK